MNEKVVKISLMILCIAILNISIVSATTGDVIDVLVDQSYSKTVSLSFKSYNTCNVTFPSSPCQMMYGDAFIVNGTGIVQYDSGYSEVAISPYVVTVTFTPTVLGEYYLIVVVISQTYTYDAETGWTLVEDIESKDAYQLNVRAGAPTMVHPAAQPKDIIESLLTWLKKLFPMITW